MLWEGASSSTVWEQVLGAESRQLGRKRPGSLRQGVGGASHSQTLPRALIMLGVGFESHSPRGCGIRITPTFQVCGIVPKAQKTTLSFRSPC